MRKTKKEAINPQAELLASLDYLEKEKGIDKEIIIEAIKNSLMTAYKNQFGPKSSDANRADGVKSEGVKADNVTVNVNGETGAFEVYAELTVVEQVEDRSTQISLEDARAMNYKCDLGDVVRKEIRSEEFGRIATKNAKDIILQKIREAERESIRNEFESKLFEVVTGIIQRKNENDITIDLGRSDAIMRASEQVDTEVYKPTERLKVLVVEIKTTTRGSRIFVSRTHPSLVKRLFEAEVTELQEGIVEIKAISREAGSRTKMAVWSNDPEVDPVGACVGMNGARVNAVVDELNGEKIDIINWSDNSAELIENALSPAKVICVIADDDDKTAQVVVPDYQLSLAIGKMGQNVRLAVRLTGYKIDIKSETQARESGLFEEIGYIEDYEDDEMDEDAYADDSVYDDEYSEDNYEEEDSADEELAEDTAEDEE